MPQFETLPARTWPLPPEQDEAAARVADFRARVEAGTDTGEVRLVLEVGDYFDRRELDADAFTPEGPHGFYCEAAGEGGYVSWGELVDVVDL